jgi:spore germination protein YaaH
MKSTKIIKNKIFERKNNIFVALFFILAFILPSVSNAATAPLEIIGWVPYWRTATGTADAIAHIKDFTEINIFGYQVKSDGTLSDPMNIASSTEWQALIQTAKKNKVRIIATIMWSDGDAIDKILRDPKQRKVNITAIMSVVKQWGFDGVDIDYENKKDVTKTYFSQFLKELYAAMGQKWVMCSIEPRTPLDSRYDTIPTNIQYANDFTAINKYCDRVIIMAYDQGNIDLKLNRASQAPYFPIADVNWVKKVVNLAKQTISKNKIIIGTATYGQEFEVASTSKGYQYNYLWPFNPKYATDLASQLGITPVRDSAGEMGFTYTAISTSTTTQLENNIPSDNLLTASTSIQNTTSTSTTIFSTFRFVSWSDALAIKAKIDLAKTLGIKGIAIYKIDGGEDQNIWNLLKK